MTTQRPVCKKRFDLEKADLETKLAALRDKEETVLNGIRPRGRRSFSEMQQVLVFMRCDRGRDTHHHHESSAKRISGGREACSEVITCRGEVT